MKHNLIKMAGVLFLSNFTNVGNYLFQIILGRELEPSAFGIYNAVAGIGLIFGFFGPVIPNLIAKFLINSPSQEAKERYWRFFCRMSFWIGIATTTAMVAFAPVLKDILEIPSLVPIFIFSAAIGTLIWLFSFQGLLSTFGKYIEFSSFLTGHSFLRLALLALSLFGLGWSYNGALGTMVIANLLTIAGLMYYSRVKGLLQPFLGSLRQHRLDQLPVPRKAMSVFFAPAISAQLLHTLITNVDILLVQAFSGARQAGIYSFAAILSRVAIFLPMMLLTVLFPEMVRTQGRDAQQKMLWQVLSLTFLTSGGYWLVLYFGRDMWLEWIFGAQALEATPLIGYLAGAMVLFSLTNVLFQKHLALGTYRFLAPSFVCCFVGGAIIFTLMPSTAYGVAQGMLWLNAILLLSLLLFEWSLRSKGESTARDPSVVEGA